MSGFFFLTKSPRCNFGTTIITTSIWFWWREKSRRKITGFSTANTTSNCFDDDDEDFPSDPLTNVFDNNGRPQNFQSNAPAIEDLTDYNNDIEEEMVKAAIETSERDAILLDGDNVAGSSIHHAIAVEDLQLARADSLSLKVCGILHNYSCAYNFPSLEGADREKEMHRLAAEHHNVVGAPDLGKVSSSSKRLDWMWEAPWLSMNDDDVKEQPLWVGEFLPTWV